MSFQQIENKLVVILKEREDYLRSLSDDKILSFLKLNGAWERLQMLNSEGVVITDFLIKEVLRGYNWAYDAAKKQVDFENKVTRGNMKFPLESFWFDNEKAKLCFLESFDVVKRKYEVMCCSEYGYEDFDPPRFVTHSGHPISIKESELEEGISSGKYKPQYPGKDFEWVG